MKKKFTLINFELLNYRVVPLFLILFLTLVTTALFFAIPRNTELNGGRHIIAGVRVALVPAAPTNVRGDNPSSCGSFTLRWDHQGIGEFYFDVSTTPDFSPGTKVYDNVKTTFKQFSLVGLKQGTIYYFRVKACDKSGCSDYSMIATYTTIAISAPQVSGGSIYNCMNWIAQWTPDVNNNIFAYLLDVSRFQDFRSYEPGYENKDVGNSKESVISGLVQGGTYYYRVRSKSGCGISAYSNVIPFTLKGNGSSTPGTISGGASSVCVGSDTPAFTKDPNSWPSTGIWSIFNQTGNATISTSGVVTGVSPGYVKVVFSTKNGECMSSTTKDLEITGGTVGVASLSPTVCIGSGLPTILHNTNGVKAIGAATGLPTGVTISFSSNVISISGTPTDLGTFNYSIPLTTNCGSVIKATGVIIVNPAVSSGTVSLSNILICIGSTSISSNNGTTGGTWSSSNTSIAKVSSNGVVTGIASGSSTITYTVNGCGLQQRSSADITVKPQLSTSVNLAVFPSNIICAGSSGPLTFTASPENGGTMPVYQWRLNGADIEGADSSTFTSSELKENDKVTVVMTSNSVGCSTLLPVTSNSIAIATKTTVYDGRWSLAPAANLSVELRADYSSDINLNACALIVTNNSAVTINKKNSFTVQNNVIVDVGSSLTIESDANLIQINNAAPANSGNITVLRDIKIGAGRTQYNYLGSPVTFASGQNLKTIYPGITFALYHVESNNFFGNSSGANIPGRGLAVKEPTTTGVAAGTTVVTAQYKGVPQNGEIRFALANSNTDTNSSFGYNLLGNPYPSNIDLTKLYDLNGGDHAKGKVSKNIDATFYLWDNEVNNDIALAQQGSAYKGQAYAVYNVLAGSKGTGTSAAGYLNNNIIGAKKPEQVLKVGQGFMTKAIAKNYTLIFNNSIRTEAEVTSSFLGRGQSQDVEDDRFWLKLISPANLTSTMAVVYYEGGSNTFGAEDSESKLGSDDIFSLVDDQKVAVNGKSSFTDSDKIALGTQHFQSGIYTIGLEAKEGVFAQGQPIYLKDKQTGNVTKLTEGTYSFEVEAGETADRFEIIYQPETVLVTDTKTKESVVVYRDADQFIIKAQKRLSSVFVYDLSGKMIKVLKPNQKEVALDANQLSSAVYVLSITAEDGEVFNRKISK